MSKVTMAKEAFLHSPRYKRSSTAQVSRGNAFVIEILILLIFLIFTLTVFVQLLGKAWSMSTDSQKLSEAIQLATNTAERFAANPERALPAESTGSLVANIAVKSETHVNGYFYNAIISVSDEAGKQIYQLKTSKFIPDKSPDSAPEAGPAEQGGVTNG